MLSPWVSKAFFCASALNAMKLLGDDAAIHCSTAKRMRLRVLASASTASARPISVRALSKYTAAAWLATGLLPQAASEKRLSVVG